MKTVNDLKCGDLVIFTDETLQFVDTITTWNPISFHKKQMEKFDGRTGIVIDKNGVLVLVVFGEQEVWLLYKYLKKITNEK